MSLLLPFSNNQFHSKPMAISSITSPATTTTTTTTTTSATAATEYRPLSPTSQSPPSYFNQEFSPSISLQERRLRNKTASAKYRAKKNQQHCEMRSMIATLTKENELLMRQLDHIQHENNHLKATCDKLRGKMIAQKILKQYLVETTEQRLLDIKE